MSLKKKFAHVELTDVGRVREHNEDDIGSQPDIGLWVLADGMGGYNAGEVASGIAVKTVIDLVTEACRREKRNALEPETGYMRQTIVLRDAIMRANKIIHQTAQSQPQCEGMGTTLVACLFYDDRVSVAHVGVRVQGIADGWPDASAWLCAFGQGGVPHDDVAPALVGLDWCAGITLSSAS